jgi:hypothetical protein
MRKRYPRVITNCVANHYAWPDERIIEVSFADGAGCLISILDLKSPRRGVAPHVINVYQRSPGIRVNVGPTVGPRLRRVREA